MVKGSSQTQTLLSLTLPMKKADALTDEYTHIQVGIGPRSSCGRVNHMNQVYLGQRGMDVRQAFHAGPSELGSKGEEEWR